MASKRNKLLIILGLVTIAVSKSHNQRFPLEHDFESKRTSASNVSANSSQTAAKRADLKLSDKLIIEKPINNYKGYLSSFHHGESVQQKPAKVEISYENDHMHMPTQKIMTYPEEQGQRRSENVHNDDSSDLSVEIDPEDFNFEPQKVKKVRKIKGTRKQLNKPEEVHEVYFNRRQGELSVDANQDTKALHEKAINKTQNKDAGEKSKFKIEPVTMSDDKKILKKDKSKRRKKVLRVRARNPKNSKSRKIDEKINQKAINKEKLLIVDTSAKSSNNKSKHDKEVKILEDIKPAFKDQKENGAIESKISLPFGQKNNFEYDKGKIKSTILYGHSEGVKAKSSNPVAQKDSFEHDKNNPKDIKANESNETKIDPNNKDHIVTFFRRSGGKTVSQHAGQADYPNADWISMYKTENRNKDGNYYMLSFNYMGNKNHHQVKDIMELPPITSREKQQTFPGEQRNFAPFKEAKQYSTEELNIDHLGKLANKFLKTQKEVTEGETTDQSKGYYLPEKKDIQTKGIVEDNRYSKASVFTEEHDTLVEKQLTPTVTLMRKKSKKNQEAVWKLQEPKKKFPDDQWKQSNKEQAHHNDDHFKSTGEDHTDQTHNLNKDRYYVRSFVKQPFGASIDLNSKDGEKSALTDFDKSFLPRAPLLRSENDGNYFMRMYKKVGSVENLGVQNGENQERNGYLSSFKLSWKDDDTKAQVEEAVDSRAVSPTHDSYSSESNESYEKDEDTYSTAESENIMQYKPRYVDDFMSPLRGDKSHFSDSIPFVHRIKRSPEKENYFMRMYKKFGIAENTPSARNSGDSSNYGYSSSMKLSWENDDTKAHVDEIKDSLAVLPTHHSHSTRRTELRGSGERDTDSTAESENITHHKPVYTDDFISTLREDKTNFSDNIPIVNRPKRSSENGNYFTHIYKKIGNTENSPKGRSGTNPENYGHSSSLKLSWKDDDTKATVDEVKDSLAVLPTPHSHSIRRFESREINGKDAYSTGESKNIMHHKPRNEDNITSPQHKDELHYSKSVLSVPRRKRSAENAPRVSTHFKIGDFNVQSNHTLKNIPRSRLFNRRLGPSFKGKVEVQRIIQANTQPRNSEMQVIIAKRKNSNLKSYYQKPIEARNIKQLEAGFKTNKTDIFDKYEKPSRDVKNIQIFHSYQSPNRDSERAHNITYFHNDKNSNMKIEISDKGGHTQFQNLQSILQRRHASNIDSLSKFRTTPQTTVVQSSNNLNKGNSIQFQNSQPALQRRNVSNIVDVSNFKTTPRTTAVQSSTNLKPTYIEPNRNISSDKIKHYQSHTDQVKEYSTSPAIQSRADETTLKPVTESRSNARNVHKNASENDQLSQKHPNVQQRRIDDKHWNYYGQNNANDKEYEHQLEEQDNVDKNVLDTEHSSNGDNINPDVYDNEDHQPISKGITPKVPFHWDQQYYNVYYSAEKNHPTYSSIPKTHFSCKKKTPGYYADPETGCQVFHMCQATGEKHSFLCPNTTVFNQVLLVCDWHSKVNCEMAESFYDVNNHIYAKAPEQVRDSKHQYKKHRTTQQDKRNGGGLYLHSENPNNNQKKNRPKQVDIFQDKEVTSVPRFIVDQLKDKVPNAEIGKPKMVTKSYSAVIEKPKANINFPTKSYKVNHQEKQDEIPIVYGKFLPSTDKNFIPGKLIDTREAIRNSQDVHKAVNYPTSTNEKLIPKEFITKQKSIKNSWNPKDTQSALKQEFSPGPDINNDYNKDEDHILYTQPLQEKSPAKYYLHRSKNPNPFKNNEKVYYTPSFNNDDIHFAGRQNEKVIVINRNRLQPGYESSEDQNSNESKTTLTEESPTKFEQPLIDSIQVKHTNHKGSYGTEARKQHIINNYDDVSKNQRSNNDKKLQYTYPLPNIMQNRHKTKELNNDYRTEKPKNVNFQNSQNPEPRLNIDPIVKQNMDAVKDPQANKIKWRIEEIKSGVESIGAQVGKLLDGTDSTFKKVRIFQLKPNNVTADIQEIKLRPFKFERHSKVPHDSKVNEEKEGVLSFNNDKTIPKAFDSTDTVSPNKQLKNSKPSNIHSHSNGNAAQNIQVKHDHARTFAAVPKLIQKIVKDIVPQQNKFRTHSPNRADYGNDLRNLKTYDQMTKDVPQSSRNSTISIVNKKEKPVISKNDNKNINLNKKLSRSETRVIDYNTEIKPASESIRKDTISNKKYEIKYIPLIKLDETTEQRYPGDTFPPKQTNLKYKPEYSHVNSNGEIFEHVFVPKKIPQGKESSLVLFPDKIHIHGNTDAYATVPTRLTNFDFHDAAVGQNTKTNFNNQHPGNVPTINTNRNENFVANKLFNVQRNINKELPFLSSKPNNQQKKVRTLLLISKRIPETKNHTNFKTNKPIDINTYNKYISTQSPQNFKSHQNLNPSFEFDQTSYTLGKNGPSHDLIKSSPLTTETKPNGGSTVYYNPQGESLPKCKDHSESKSLSEDSNSLDEEMQVFGQDKKIHFHSQPASKIMLKKLQQPKPIYAFDENGKMYPKVLQKSIHEANPPKGKPIKLFDLPRSSRPAFVKSVSPTKSTPDMDPTVRELTDYNLPSPNIEEKTSDESKDKKSGERSKRVVNDRYSRYADLEREAEIAGLKKTGNDKKSETNFPVARSKPQGMITAESSEETSISSSNDPKDLKYAALEKAAELEAEQMVRSKSQST